MRRIHILFRFCGILSHGNWLRLSKIHPFEYIPNISLPILVISSVTESEYRYVDMKNITDWTVAQYCVHVDAVINDLGMSKLNIIV